MTFTTEIALDVVVEVLDATRERLGRVHDRPERSEPAEPAEVTVAVWLHGDGPDQKIDLAPFLPLDVREAITIETLERLDDV